MKIYRVNTLTLSLAIEANLLAPTAKLLQPCKSKEKHHRGRKIQQRAPLSQRIYLHWLTE